MRLIHKRLIFEHAVLLIFAHFNIEDPSQLFKLISGLVINCSHSTTIVLAGMYIAWKNHVVSSRSIDNWNNLAENIFCSTSVDAFKNKLDKAWRSSGFSLEDIYN